MNIQFCWYQLLREHQSDFWQNTYIGTNLHWKHPWETPAVRKIPEVLYQKNCMGLLCWYMIKNHRPFYQIFVYLWNMFRLQSGLLKNSRKDRKVFPNFKIKSIHSSQDRLSDISVHPFSIGLRAFCFCCLQSTGYLGRLNPSPTKMHAFHSLLLYLHDSIIFTQIP